MKDCERFWKIVKDNERFVNDMWKIFERSVKDLWKIMKDNERFVNDYERWTFIELSWTFSEIGYNSPR